MSPLQFEAAHESDWLRLERGLDALEGTKPATRRPTPPPDGGEDLLLLYRRVCGHLALAEARAYPLPITQRLQSLCRRGHDAIYRPAVSHALQRLTQHLLVAFPRAVAQHAGLVALAAAITLLPLILMAWATWRDPSFALMLLDAEQLREFDKMYGPATESIGRRRNVGSDWMMFGFYIYNNIGVGFRCFATGLVAGLGPLFFLAYNGALFGTVAAHLQARGLGAQFWPFVATHSAFELTAIVLMGAAGLALGRAVLLPGRQTRRQSLVDSAHRVAPIVSGSVAMLVIAAVLEAFWSSSVAIAPAVKYTVAATCWVAVMLFLASRRGASSTGATWPRSHDAR